MQFILLGTPQPRLFDDTASTMFNSLEDLFEEYDYLDENGQRTTPSFIELYQQEMLRRLGSEFETLKRIPPFSRSNQT